MVTAAIPIHKLRSEVGGRVIEPHDADYEAASTIFYGGYESRPAAIVRASDAKDVASVIRFARETGVELAVRSGGHSVAGHSTTAGGLVLDLREMTSLEIDVDGRTAWAQSGLTAGEYSSAAGAYGLATSFGDTGSVGIGGITLGGGIGYLVRKHGMTIDSLLAAEVVTADGDILQVDEQNHPDLFWAIRGGGGNFGVATWLRYRLHDVGKVLGGMMMLPATAETIASFMALAEAAPDELSTIANVMTAPPMPMVPAEHHGKLVLLALVCYAGDTATGERVLAPLRALGQPLLDAIAEINYPAIYPPDDDAYHPTAASRTMFVDAVDGEVADTVLRYIESSDAVMRVAQLRTLGGAMARVPSDATAFAHRKSKIMVNVAAFYNGPEDRIVRDMWVEEFSTALRQKDQGAYVNFLGVEGDDQIRRAYPEATWDRLVAVKAKYDPTNLFRLNQNIPPA